MENEKLAKIALNLRKNVVRMLAAAGSGHPAGTLGLADIYAAIFFAKSPEIFRENYDHFVISNGHTVPIFYSVLREKNLISDAEMLTLRKFGSRIQGHPERIFRGKENLPLLETTSGPLGEGLSQGAGMAYAEKNFAKNDKKVIVMLGDGELDEGENWEAAMFAAKNHLANLLAVVDVNKIQLSGETKNIMPLEPLAGKFAAFGWHVLQTDGNDFREILEAFAKAENEKTKPTVILAKTIPGRGVTDIENDYHWHGKAPTAEMAEKWLAELDENFAKKGEKK